MNLKISELPLEAQQQIPLSIRSYSDEYNINDLPASVRTMLDNYLKRTPEVEYKIAFDALPQVSEYGDLRTIQNVISLVVEYLKNYFMIFPEDYPFDPYFGSRLKRYLQMKDTSLQQTLINNEVQNVITALSGDLNVNIQVEEVIIEPQIRSVHTEYKITLKVKINDTAATISF